MPCSWMRWRCLRAAVSELGQRGAVGTVVVVVVVVDVSGTAAGGRRSGCGT